MAMESLTTPSTPVAASRYLWGCALVMAAGVVLSLGVFTIRIADAASTWQYILWRSIGVAIALSLIARLRDGRHPLEQLVQLSRVGWIGALSLALAAAAFIYAVRISTFAETFFLCSLAPLIAALLARPLLGERIGIWTLAAIAIGLAGVYIMIGGRFDGGNWMGRVLALVSAVAFAGYTLSTRGASSLHLDAMLIAFGLVSALTAAVVLTATGEPLWPSLRDASLALLHGSVILAVGLWLLGQGSRHVTAVTLTMLAQTEAVVAPVWAYLFFDETPTAGVIAGGLVILTAVALQTVHGARERSSNAAAARRISGCGGHPGPSARPCGRAARS